MEEEKASKVYMQPEMRGWERQGLPLVLPWWQLGEGQLPGRSSGV